MSQLRRQIAVGAVIAILSAFGLGLGVNFLLPSQGASSTSSSTVETTSTTIPSSTLTSTTQVTSTATSTLTSSSVSTSTATITSTTTYSSVTSATTTTTSTSSSSSASATTVLPSYAANPAVKPDPALSVSLAQSVLLSGNATKIAEQLASLLGEAPVTSTGVVQQAGNFSPVYSYRTAFGSHIDVTFFKNSFYQLDYENAVQSGQSTGGVFTSLNASAGALKVLGGMGLPVATDRLMIQIENYSPQLYVIQWGQAYEGVPVEGTLATNPDGSYFMLGNQAYFEFNPQSGLITRIILIGPDWYTVDDGFPLAISPLQAAHIGAAFAQGLGVATIGEPQVNFVVINGSLYYVVTVGNSSQAINLVINPRTGEVGLPG